MELTLVGLNHKTAPIALREEIAFAEAALPCALQTLRNDFGFGEAMIISTCNRVEILADNSRNGSPSDQIAAFLSQYHGVNPVRFAPHLYTFREDDLVRHVFRVASSLDSMVPGEAQILGQIKQAYAISQDAGTIGKLLTRLIPHAFYVAKRVRRETQVGTSSVSVSSVAVELARKIFGELDGQEVLLLGAGKMGELATKSLLKAGANKIRVANRTHEKAVEAASRFGGEVAKFDELEESMTQSDIIIVSTGADRHIIGKTLVETVVHRRKFSPIFIIDISVPRNVSPEVNDIENAFLYDIDDLQSVVSTHLQERSQEAELGEEIVGYEVTNFARICQGVPVGPLVSALRQKLEHICLEELGKDDKGFTVEEREKIERMLRRTAHRIAHPIMREMKRGDGNPTRQYHNLEMIKKAFDLKDPK
jgi:glutamyl-tRNA reductase